MVAVAATLETMPWQDALAPGAPGRDEALARLHALLLRAARFEVARRRGALGRATGAELDDLAHQAADDALVAILRKLADFRGESRFETWAYKFAILEAAMRVRRHAWRGRDVRLDDEQWPLVSDDAPGPDRRAESDELLGAIGRAIREELTDRQREVLVAREPPRAPRRHRRARRLSAAERRHRGGAPRGSGRFRPVCRRNRPHPYVSR